MTATLENVANKFFDYVICGGGTAGLTLAARLSDDPTVSVLVLEAGASTNVDDPAILRPASWGSHLTNDSYCWNHKTVKQAINGTEHGWARGKGLGGSSAVNFLCWTKPHAEDINDFERLGNPGWNWNEHEKYLARTEGFLPPGQEVQNRNNMCFDMWKIGKEGPLKIAYPGTIDEAELKVQQTLLNAGLPVAPLPLSGDPTGVFFTPNTYDPVTHTRSYATTAFYEPNKDRSNLSVLVNAAVDRILMDKTGNGKLNAVGVEFQYAGSKHIVNARKEVILSTGSLKSPHILELSGIGRKEVLKKAGIPPKLELPGVGENVQEHMFIGVSFELRNDVEFDTVDILRDSDVAARHLELHATGTGIFTKGIIGFAFVPLQMLSKKADAIYESAQAKVLNDAGKYPPGLMEQYEIQLKRMRAGAPSCEFISFPGHLSGPNPPVEGKRYVTILVAMNSCFSRGTIHSTSTDPRKDPAFDPRYLQEEVDLDVWCEMVKFTRDLAQVAPLKDMIVHELNPGPDVKDDSQVRDWIKTYFSTTWHTSSSCSMLPLASGGVVDPELKVYGTNNVRVVDLSIVPLQFGAHPQATVYAIAEKAAEIIKTTLHQPTPVRV